MHLSSKFKVIFFLGLIFSNLSNASDLTLYFGFVTKVKCQGKLSASVIGNDALVKFEPMPSELGCGGFLKPLQQKGQTNFFIETNVTSSKAVIFVTDKLPDSKIELTKSQEVNL